MPLKRCETRDCDTEVRYDSEEELKVHFRKVGTHSGAYFRNVCRKCEAEQQRKRRENKKRVTGLDVDDYPGGLSLLGGGFDG